MAGYTIKITLENTRPPVWRRILIPDAISFSDLHKIIQTAFGWEDMHLHDFRPAGSDFDISPKEAMTACGREFDETELTVDGILQSSRWIRYTYDFGDDWRHKIELEKEEPDYQDRHAVIIKAKGDNFAEDCAWDENDRIGFSLLDANIVLAGMDFTRKKPSAKQNMICQLLQDEKELENLYGETRRLQQKLDRLARIKEQETSGNQRKSKAEQLIRRWELFCAGYENRTEKRAKRGADSPKDYEQLSLPGIEVREKPSSARLTDDVFLLAANYRVDMTRSEKEVRQLLLNASVGELKDYCRYIGVESSLYSGNKSKTVRSELFTDAMRTYPEFIYYVFSKDEYKWMLKVCFSPAKDIDISGMSSCVGKMIALGFAAVSFRMEDDMAIAELETAADLESILPVEKGRRLNRRYSEIEDADRFILSLLHFLGKAELEYIYETYGDYLKMFPEKADFFRFIYGYYTFPCRTVTGSVSKGRPIIVHPGLNFQETAKLCAPYEKRLSYRVFEKWDLDAMSHGITFCYPEWELYDSLLRHDAHLLEHEAGDVFGATFAGVLRGWTQDEIRKTFEERIYGSERKGLDDCVELWLYSMQLVMETALPMFRGYSRHELADMGWKADELALFSETNRGEIKKETGLFELDSDMQLRLYRISQNDEADIGEYDEILKECGCENYEIRWLRVMDAMMTGEYDLAESEIKVLSVEKKDKNLLEYLESVRLFRTISEDADDFEEELLSAGEQFVLDEFGWDDFDAPKVPYRRETPKIGRNDPCPCGSGKKYKKCCGR